MVDSNSNPNMIIYFDKKMRVQSTDNKQKMGKSSKKKEKEEKY